MLQVAAEKLRDSGYFGLHLEAIASIRAVGAVGWYDAQFLQLFETARHYLAKVRPDALTAFKASFAPLVAPEAFREIAIDDVFDAATREAIIAASRNAAISRTSQQERENRHFGRDVVWDEPFYLELQQTLRPKLESILGRPLVSCYNFLSLYGPEGKCEPHLDHPNAMFTFDYCIDQDEVWPIHVSRAVPWPDAAFAKNFDPAKLKSDPAMAFRTHELRPNNALVFNGSSQWHYREPKSSGRFCHLLFFHYYAADCEDLVHPPRWADCTGIAELQPLCDLFETVLTPEAGGRLPVPNPG